MATITNTVKWVTNTDALRAELAKGLDQITATRAGAEKMVQALGGDRLIAAAHKYAAAVQEIGGAAKLTESEQARVNAVVQKAIEKYQALGKEAPTALRELAAATKKTADASGSFTSMLGQANSLLGTFGIGLSVGAVVGFGRALLADADALVKLSDKTGISVEGLQRLQVAGDDAGNSLDDLTGAVNMMQKRLGGGDASALGALKQLGLEFDDLKHLAPDRQFMAIADAVRAIHDPMQQVAIASDLFGKNAANVLPTIKRGFDDLKDSAPGMSAEAVKALDDTGDAITRLWRTTKGAIGEAAGQALRTIMMKDFEAPDLLGQAAKAAPPTRDLFPTGVALGAVEEKAALEDLNEQLKKNQEAARKAREEAEKQLTAWTNLTAGAEDLDGTIESEIRSWLALGKSQSDIATAYGVTGAAVAAVAKQMAFEQSVVDATTKAFGRQLAMFTPLTERYGAFHDQLHTLIASQNQFHDGLTVAGDVMANVPIPLFGTLPNVQPQNTKLIQEATAKARTFGDTLSASMKDMPNVMAAAFTGGGGLSGALKAMTSTTVSGLFGEKGAFEGATKAATGGLTKIFGGTIGKALGGAIPFVGPALAAFAPAILGGFKKLFGGVSEEEKKGRDTVKAFEAQIASTLTATQKAEAGGQSWKMTAIGVRDAYLKAGKSAAEADAAVQKLWASSKLGAEATKAAIEEINGVLEDQKQDEADLQAAIQRYGFSIEQLGPAMQKQKLDDQAKQLLNDWRLLVGSGISIVDVDQKMASSINDYLKLARKTGQEVPIAMKPILQTMIENGTLLDENGNAITDMGQLGVTWSETMTQGFDRIVKKLDDLLVRLGRIPAAINNIPTDVDLNIHPRPGGGDDEGGSRPGRGEYAARGGFVTALGIQHFDLGGRVKASGWRAPWTLAPIGSDTVPAMLTPGELILNQGQQSQIAALLEKGVEMAGSLAAGGGRAPLVINETVNIRFEVETTNAADFDAMIDDRIMPRITTNLENRWRGYTSRWQQVLGTT